MLESCGTNGRVVLDDGGVSDVKETTVVVFGAVLVGGGTSVVGGPV